MLVEVSKLKNSDYNPRSIREERFKKLKQSISEFPEMLHFRPLVVNDQMEVIGGNMRLLACRELGIKEVPVIYADHLSPEAQKQFMIKDNLNYGEWDYDVLANVWDIEALNDWGMDLPTMDSGYVPVYEPTIDTNDITEEQIQIKAKELAEQMVKSQKSADVMCPNCGHEFKVS